MGTPVTLAVGCSWGKHRSVTIVMELAQELKRSLTSSGQKLRVTVTHREQAKWKAARPWLKDGRRGERCVRERHIRDADDIEAEMMLSEMREKSVEATSEGE